MTESTRWTASETAARLGVKPETLYAYVSRGMLSRNRTPDGSTFDPFEVERFAAGRRRSPDRPAIVLREGRPSGGPLMTIDTDVAMIEDDELYYRGRSATELARTTDFEIVCRWLWTGEDDQAGDREVAQVSAQVSDQEVRFSPLPGAVRAVCRVQAAMPSEASLTDRIRVMVPVVAALDPLREVLDADSVASRTGALLGTLAAGVCVDPAVPAGERIANRLCAALVGVDQPFDKLRAPVDEPVIPPDKRASLAHCVNAALVLLVDHDLAVSTLAARVAASARANPYAVVLSGLGALDSALHGNASRAAYRMVAAVEVGEDPRAVIGRTLAAGRTGVPGFGHRIYRGADPRAELIFELLAHLDGAGPALAAAAAITGLVTDHGAIFRNVDLALGTLARATGMPEEAGEVIFSIARIGGWIAHALDEYQRPALRLRPVGRYVGP